MDRSRRQGASGARPPTAPPASSRLTVRKHKNRRKPGSLWARLPKPAAVADACGRALRRSLPVAAIALATCGAAAGVWAGYRWITGSPRFAITEISIHGTQRVDADALRASLPLHVGDNVFAGLAGVSRTVRALPWVASVEVRRVLPHTIAIEIREHTAAAAVALGDAYLVDAAGRPFKRAERGEADGLPVITGLERAAYLENPDATAQIVRDAIDAAARWRAADRPALREVQLDAHGAVTLRTERTALAIQLGALGPQTADRIRRFDAAWAGLSEAERDRARAIHLDARPDHVTVALAKD